MWLNLSHYRIFIFIIFIFRTACQQTESSNMIKEGEEAKEGRYWTSTYQSSSNHIESAPSEGGVTTMERLKKRKKLRGCEWERKRKKRRKRFKSEEEEETGWRNRSNEEDLKKKRDRTLQRCRRRSEAAFNRQQRTRRQQHTNRSEWFYWLMLWSVI